MTYPFCPREEKIAVMLTEDDWRQTADPGLLKHAETCSSCSEILSTVELLRANRASTMISAHTSSPGFLWWKAQLRRRSGVVEQMTRPVVWAEALALTGILGIVVGFCFWQREQLVAWFSSILGLSILAGLMTILCVGGLTLFLSSRKL